MTHFISWSRCLCSNYSFLLVGCNVPFSFFLCLLHVACVNQHNEKQIFLTCFWIFFSQVVVVFDVVCAKKKPSENYRLSKKASKRRKQSQFALHSGMNSFAWKRNCSILHERPWFKINTAAVALCVHYCCCC